VRHVGFSTHAPLPVIVDTVRTGEFDYINLHWYWIFQENWPAILEARRQDMGVFIISPNDKGGKLYEPTPKLVELCQPFAPMAFNDLFCLARPEVHTLSLGAARPEDFDAHVEAVGHLNDPARPWENVDRRLHRHMEAALGTDWARHSFDGLPEWEQVPGEINLRVLLRLWNLDEAFGMRDYAKMRYNLLGQADHWFPGKNAAGFSEEEILRCLARYRFRDRIPDILRQAHTRWFEKPAQRLSQEKE
jgi:predicted aldo/keto reductase-like oxidoreductase